MLLMGLVFAGSLFATTSCKKDPYNTDQMSSGKVTIQVYGPRPATRGGEMRFIGTHMERVTGIVFPVAGEVTEITRKSNTEISVTVPANAGYGSLVVKSSDGDITLASEMTYAEPIEVTWITETPVKAGSKVQVKGNYLYLVTRVIFEGGAFVDLTDADKTFDPNDPAGEQSISVTVPETARTGRLVMSTIEFDANGTEIGVATEVGSGELVATIVEPGLASFSPATVKAGANLTITGTNFDLVQAIAFAGVEEPVGTFTANAAGTSITVAVPKNAQDGNVILIAKSGAETVSANELVMLLPTITSISPDPVKNGAELTITGTDLDLVTGVIFGGNSSGAIDGDRTATTLKVTVPINAKEGVVTLTTAADKETVSEDELTLVKPTITANPSAIAAGGEMTLEGEDFDLITAVNFLGDKDNADDDLTVEVAPEDAASPLTIAVPALAQAGVITLTLVNGDAFELPAITIDAPAFAFIPVLPGADEEIMAGEILVVEVINADKLTGVQVNGVDTQYILNGSVLSILVPSDAGGATAFKLVSSNGEVIYTIPVIGTLPIETVVWEGTIDMVTHPWGGAAQVSIPNAGFANANPGDTVRFYVQNTGADAQIQVNYGDWGGVIVTLMPSPGDQYSEFTLTEDQIAHILAPAWGSDAFVVQGTGSVVYKIALIQ